MNQRSVIPLFTLNSAHAENDHFSSATQIAGNYLISLMDWILDRLEHGQDRTALAQMDARELKDIGLTRSDIEKVTAYVDQRPAA
jgi:uncharacterized protein YjiS (DUF1127 family)